MTNGEEPISIPLVWIGAEDTSIVLANSFVIQHEQDEFVLIVGQYTPPILLGSPEERLEQAKKVAYVPVKVVSRIGFTRQRLVELVDVLKTHLEKYDRKHTGQKS